MHSRPLSRERSVAPDPRPMTSSSGVSSGWTLPSLSAAPSPVATARRREVGGMRRVVVPTTPASVVESVVGRASPVSSSETHPLLLDTSHGPDASLVENGALRLSARTWGLGSRPGSSARTPAPGSPNGSPSLGPSAPVARTQTVRLSLPSLGLVPRTHASSHGSSSSTLSSTAPRRSLRSSAASGFVVPSSLAAPALGASATSWAASPVLTTPPMSPALHATGTSSRSSLPVRTMDLALGAHINSMVVLSPPSRSAPAHGSPNLRGSWAQPTLVSPFSPTSGFSVASSSAASASAGAGGPAGGLVGVGFAVPVGFSERQLALAQQLAALAQLEAEMQRSRVRASRERGRLLRRAWEESKRTGRDPPLMLLHVARIDSDVDGPMLMLRRLSDSRRQGLFAGGDAYSVDVNALHAAWAKGSAGDQVGESDAERKLLLSGIWVEWNLMSEKERLLELSSAVSDGDVRRSASRAGVTVPLVLQLGSSVEAHRALRQAFESWYSSSDPESRRVRAGHLLRSLEGAAVDHDITDQFWEDLNADARLMLLHDAANDVHVRVAAVKDLVPLPPFQPSLESEAELDRRVAEGANSEELKAAILLEGTVADPENTDWLAPFSEWFGTQTILRRGFIARVVQAASSDVADDVVDSASVSPSGSRPQSPPLDSNSLAESPGPIHSFSGSSSFIRLGPTPLGASPSSPSSVVVAPSPGGLLSGFPSSVHGASASSLPRIATRDGSLGAPAGPTSPVALGTGADGRRSPQAARSPKAEGLNAVPSFRVVDASGAGRRAAPDSPVAGSPDAGASMSRLPIPRGELVGRLRIEGGTDLAPSGPVVGESGSETGRGWENASLVSGGDSIVGTEAGTNPRSAFPSPSPTSPPSASVSQPGSRPFTQPSGLHFQPAPGSSGPPEPGMRGTSPSFSLARDGMSGSPSPGFGRARSPTAAINADGVLSPGGSRTGEPVSLDGATARRAQSPSSLGPVGPGSPTTPAGGRSAASSRAASASGTPTVPNGRRRANTTSSVGSVGSDVLPGGEAGVLMVSDDDGGNFVDEDGEDDSVDPDERENVVGDLPTPGVRGRRRLPRKGGGEGGSPGSGGSGAAGGAGGMDPVLGSLTHDSFVRILKPGESFHETPVTSPREGDTLLSSSKEDVDDFGHGDGLLDSMPSRPVLRPGGLHSTTMSGFDAGGYARSKPNRGSHQGGGRADAAGRADRAGAGADRAAGTKTLHTVGTWAPSSAAAALAAASAAGGGSFSTGSRPLHTKLKSVSRFNMFTEWFQANQKSRMDYLHKIRVRAATRVLVRFMVRVRMWRTRRRKAGKGAMAAHFLGVAWDVMSKEERAAELSCAVLDSFVRQAAATSGILVPGPLDSSVQSALVPTGSRSVEAVSHTSLLVWERWYREQVQAARSEHERLNLGESDAPDAGGDGGAPSAADGVDAGAREAVLRTIEEFVEWYSSSSGPGVLARAGFLAREVSSAVFDGSLRAFVGLGPSAEAAAGSAPPATVEETTELFTWLADFPEATDRSWENSSLVAAANLPNTPTDAVAIQRAIDALRSANPAMDPQEARRRTLASRRRWDAFKRWFQSPHPVARRRRREFLLRRAEEALQWVGTWTTLRNEVRASFGFFDPSWGLEMEQFASLAAQRGGVEPAVLEGLQRILRFPRDAGLPGFSMDVIQSAALEEVSGKGDAAAAAQEATGRRLQEILRRRRRGAMLSSSEIQAIRWKWTPTQRAGLGGRMFPDREPAPDTSAWRRPLDVIEGARLSAYISGVDLFAAAAAAAAAGVSTSNLLSLDAIRALVGAWEADVLRRGLLDTIRKANARGNNIVDAPHAGMRGRAGAGAGAGSALDDPLGRGLGSSSSSSASDGLGHAGAGGGSGAGGGALDGAGGAGSGKDGAGSGGGRGAGGRDGESVGGVLSGDALLGLGRGGRADGSGGVGEAGAFGPASASGAADLEEEARRKAEEAEARRRMEEAAALQASLDEEARRRQEEMQEAAMREMLRLEEEARLEAEAAAAEAARIAAEEAAAAEAARLEAAAEEAKRLAEQQAREKAEREREEALRREWLEKYRRAARHASARAAEKVKQREEDRRRQIEELALMREEDAFSWEVELGRRAELTRWKALERVAFAPFKPFYGDSDVPTLRPPRAGPVLRAVLTKESERFEVSQARSHRQIAIESAAVRRPAPMDGPLLKTIPSTASLFSAASYDSAATGGGSRSPSTTDGKAGRGGGSGGATVGMRRGEGRYDFKPSPEFRYSVGLRSGSNPVRSGPTRDFSGDLPGFRANLERRLATLEEEARMRRGSVMSTDSGDLVEIVSSWMPGSVRTAMAAASTAASDGKRTSSSALRQSGLAESKSAASLSSRSSARAGDSARSGVGPPLVPSSPIVTPGKQPPLSAGAPMGPLSLPKLARP